MEYVKSHVGSALVTVMVVMAVITILAGTIMRSATLVYELSLERVAHERQIRAVQALLNYGIAWCHRIENYPKKEPHYDVSLEQWPPIKGGLYSGKVSITVTKKDYTVEAHLADRAHGGLIVTSMCHVIKEKDGWMVNT